MVRAMPAVVSTFGVYVTSFAAPAGGLSRQHAGQVAGLAAVIINAAVLIGGWAGLPLLSSWGTDFHPMRPTVALLVAALGLALVHPGKDSRFAFGVGLAVVANAALGLDFILFNVDPGIDPWLAAGTAVEGTGPASFSVAKVVALALGLAGGSLALSRSERHRPATTMLATIAGAISVFAVLGYVAGIDTLYGSVSVRSPTLPATVSLLCVAVGIILRFGTMPVLRKSRPLWHLLIMLGCAIVAPLLLFGAYAGFRVADAQFDQVGKDLAVEARTLSANVDREIIGEIEKLQALAASPSLRHGDFGEFQRQAEASLILRQSGNIMLVDRNMQQIVNTWVAFGRLLPRAPVPEAVQSVLATGKPQITGLFTGSVVRQLAFAIIVPVEIDGANRYALVRSPNQHALARLINELPSGWQAVVSDAAHRILARSEQQDAFIGKELPPSQRRAAGPAGVFEFIDAEGRPSLQTSALSALTGWETSVWAPQALLEAPVRAQWRTVGVIALMAFTLVVVLASWLGRIIARSVGQAAGAAIALGEGGPPLLGGTPVAEVNTLMTELRGAAARRHEREEKEHLLMREINHRAKNMLSVVHSIAQQTATQNPEDFVKSFSERIQALSANQDLLVRNEWNGVEIEDLVSAQLAHFADLIGSRVLVDGPRLRLTPASAQAIGLALHELATNAGKYGALSTERGRVDISWGTAGNTFTMSWTERDGPPVSAPERQGFGTAVMEAMAERSVDGTVDLDYPRSGLTWHLSCPAVNALEPGERDQRNRTDGANGEGKARTTA